MSFLLIWAVGDISKGSEKVCTCRGSSSELQQAISAFRVSKLLCFVFLPSTSCTYWSLCPNFIQVLSNPFLKVCAGVVTENIYGLSHVYLNAEWRDCSDLCAGPKLCEKTFLTIPINFYTGKELLHQKDLLEKKYGQIAPFCRQIPGALQLFSPIPGRYWAVIQCGLQFYAILRGKCMWVLTELQRYYQSRIQNWPNFALHFKICDWNVWHDPY